MATETKRSLPPLVHVLIGVHTAAAMGAAIAPGTGETGPDEAVFVAASCLAIATVLIASAHRSRLPSIRFGGIAAIAVFAALFVGLCGPMMPHAAPLASAGHHMSCGTPMAGLLIVPFVAPAMLSGIASAVARRRSHRGVRLFAVIAAVGAALASVVVLFRAPHHSVPANEWIRAQQIVASAPPITGQQTEDGRDSTPLDHFLWLHRVCVRNECQLSLSHREEVSEPFVERRFGARRPAELFGGGRLQVRYLAPIGRWHVESVASRGEHLDAVAFDAATLEPVTIHAQDLREVVGPMRANWILALASPLLALFVWLLARRGCEAPDPAASIERRHFGAGVLGSHDGTEALPSLADEQVASLRALPLGPVVIEFERVHGTPFRETDSRVRRIFAGSLAKWRDERAVASMLPWFAASVVAFCAVSGLAAWVY